MADISYSSPCAELTNYCISLIQQQQLARLDNDVGLLTNYILLITNELINYVC